MRVDRVVLFKLATSQRFERAARALPGGERAAWRAASRYVAGRDRVEALTVTAGLLGAGHGVSVDLFGELVTDPHAATGIVEDYLSLAAALPGPPADTWLSIDLTHLVLDVDPARTADRLATIAVSLPPGRRVQVGAEDASRTDAVLTCVLDVAGRGLADRLGATVQANLLRSPADADRLIGAGVHIRLVKGAYVQTTGAHPYGEPTDIAFLRLGFHLTEQGAAWSMATHDDRLREALLLALGPIPVEQLLGVRPDLLDDLHRRGIPTRVYVPYGQDWFRYWMRRLAESRGAKFGSHSPIGHPGHPVCGPWTGCSGSQTLWWLARICSTRMSACPACRAISPIKQIDEPQAHRADQTVLGGVVQTAVRGDFPRLLTEAVGRPVSSRRRSAHCGPGRDPDPLQSCAYGRTSTAVAVRHQRVSAESSVDPAHDERTLLGLTALCRAGRCSHGSGRFRSRCANQIANRRRLIVPTLAPNSSGETTVTALNDVTLELAAGQFTAITGASGSGKSTLVHCLAGLDVMSREVVPPRAAVGLTGEDLRL